MTQAPNNFDNQFENDVCDLECINYYRILNTFFTYNNLVSNIVSLHIAYAFSTSRHPCVEGGI